MCRADAAPSVIAQFVDTHYPIGIIRNARSTGQTNSGGVYQLARMAKLPDELIEQLDARAAELAARGWELPPDPDDPIEHCAKCRQAREANRNRCRRQTAALQKAGLRRGPCVECGATDRIGNHHPDYTNPKKFKRLCIACHNVEHSMIKAGWRPALIEVELAPCGHADGGAA